MYVYNKVFIDRVGTRLFGLGLLVLASVLSKEFLKDRVWLFWLMGIHRLQGMNGSTAITFEQFDYLNGLAHA
jgi:hypothetical protein